MPETPAAGIMKSRFCDPDVGITADELARRVRRGTMPIGGAALGEWLTSSGLAETDAAGRLSPTPLTLDLADALDFTV